MLPTERGRDLDAAVAVEVIGLAVIEATKDNPVCYHEHWSGDVIAEDGKFIDWYQTTRHGRRVGTHVLEYSANLSYAAFVETEIERRGLVVQYMTALTDIVEESSYEPPTGPLYDWCMREGFRIRRATPEQICLAALTAVRGAK